MAGQQSELPTRQTTGMSTFSDDAIPDVDPSNVSSYNCICYAAADTY